MKYLVECDDVLDKETGAQMTAGTFESFSMAETAKRHMIAKTGQQWTIWRIEYNFEGCADGDKS